MGGACCARLRALIRSDSPQAIAHRAQTTVPKPAVLRIRLLCREWARIASYRSVSAQPTEGTRSAHATGEWMSELRESARPPHAHRLCPRAGGKYHVRVDYTHHTGTRRLMAEHNPLVNRVRCWPRTSPGSLDAPTCSARECQTSIGSSEGHLTFNFSGASRARLSARTTRSKSLRVGGSIAARGGPAAPQDRSNPPRAWRVGAHPQYARHLLCYMLARVPVRHPALADSRPAHALQPTAGSDLNRMEQPRRWIDPATASKCRIIRSGGTRRWSWIFWGRILRAGRRATLAVFAGSSRARHANFGGSYTGRPERAVPSASGGFSRDRVLPTPLQRGARFLF